ELATRRRTRRSLQRAAQTGGPPHARPGRGTPTPPLPCAAGLRSPARNPAALLRFHARVGALRSARRRSARAALVRARLARGRGGATGRTTQDSAAHHQQLEQLLEEHGFPLRARESTPAPRKEHGVASGAQVLLEEVH